MKTLRRALLWSIGIEVFAVLLVFGGGIGLSFLSYLASAFHLPALCLVDRWPAARQTLICPVLIQWLIWFTLFACFFALRGSFQRHTSEHENYTA